MKDVIVILESVNRFVEETTIAEMEKFVKDCSVVLDAEAIWVVRRIRNVLQINVLMFAHHLQLVVLTRNVKLLIIINCVRVRNLLLEIHLNIADIQYNRAIKIRNVLKEVCAMKRCVRKCAERK